MELSYYDGIWAYGCVIVAFLVVTFAQVILRVVYAKYKQVNSSNGMTGEQVAKAILKANDINDVKVVKVSGTLTDNFNNGNRTVSLSDDIFDGTSIASFSVAAHECGHVLAEVIYNNSVPINVLIASLITLLCLFALFISSPY